MLKILINECIHEVSTFNPIPSSLEQFQCNEGHDLLNSHHNKKSEIAGALNIFESHDANCIAGFSARAMSSGGVLPNKDFEFMANKIFDSIENSKDKVDGYFFALHGAMQSPNYEDPEGWLLEEIVKRVGSTIPIVITLDLHGILTSKMCENIWGFSMLHTYPHVDFYQNGTRAAELLVHFIKTKKRPTIIDVSIPALVRGDELITETGLLGNYYKQTDELVDDNPHVLAAGLMIGNPFTDVPELKSHVIAICDDRDKNEDVGKQCAVIAKDFWDNRKRLQANLIDLNEALMKSKLTGATVVFADAADATSSGASGDSNAILKGILNFDQNIKTLLPILDAPAAEKAWEAGTGKNIMVNLGGTCDKQFSPIELEVNVTMLTEGNIENESRGGYYHAGKTALLKYKGLTIIVFSKPIHLYDRSLFLAHQCNLPDYEIIVVKSPHTRYDFFSTWVKDTFVIDAPGATSANLKRLGHKICERPLFPLDENINFTPLIRYFQ